MMLFHIWAISFLFRTAQSESILITGGFSSGEVIGHGEIINLGTGSAISCQIENLQIPVEGGVAAFVNDKVLVCGGKDKGGKIKRDCQELSKNGTWTNSFAVLDTPRLFPFGTFLNNDWIISGGSDQAGEVVDSSELYTGLGFKQGPKLPYSVNDHCLARVNSSHIILIGGKTDKTSFAKTSYLYSTLEDKWTTLPDLNIGRNGHFCGLVKGQPDKIFVSSGYQDGWVETNSVETIDLTNPMHWKEEAFKFPAKIAYGVTVDNGNGEIYMIGGAGDGKEVATVYTLDYAGKEFIDLGVRLEVPRSGFMATRIPADYVEC